MRIRGRRQSHQPASAVCATAWQDGGGSHMRVYRTDDDATTEWRLDGADTGAWHQGQYAAE